jgi:hypothetical protein
MVFGMDPEKLLLAKKAGDNIKAELTINHIEESFTMKLIPLNNAGKADVDAMVNQLAMGLATQLQTFFNIKGSLQEIR